MKLKYARFEAITAGDASFFDNIRYSDCAGFVREKYLFHKQQLLTQLYLRIPVLG